MFALAQVSGFLFFGFENERLEFGSAMRTIAKRLRFRMAAGTPGVSFSRFQFHRDGGFGSYMRFGHRVSPCFFKVIYGFMILIFFSKKHTIAQYAVTLE
jgi:hypothetical protein